MESWREEWSTVAVGLPLHSVCFCSSSELYLPTYSQRGASCVFRFRFMRANTIASSGSQCQGTTGYYSLALWMHRLHFYFAYLFAWQYIAPMRQKDLLLQEQQERRTLFFFNGLPSHNTAFFTTFFTLCTPTFFSAPISTNNSPSFFIHTHAELLGNENNID